MSSTVLASATDVSFRSRFGVNGLLAVARTLHCNFAEWAVALPFYQAGHIP